MLLGLDLALGDIAALGVWGVLAIVALVVVAFAATYGIGRLFRLPGDEPVLLAAGFSICGVSAIGAMAAARPAPARARPRSRSDTAVPTALVTLFGTLAIVVLPALSTLAGGGRRADGAGVLRRVGRRERARRGAGGGDGADRAARPRSPPRWW